MASSFCILETQKYHNKLLSVCSRVFYKTFRKLWLRPRVSVYQVSSLYKAAMLAIITSGRHLFWPGHPLLYVTCSFKLADKTLINLYEQVREGGREGGGEEGGRGREGGRE